MYRHRNFAEAEAFIDTLIAAILPPPGARILDLACGRGRHAVFLHKKGFHVTGIDLSPESIKDASAHAAPALEFFVHDMREPFQFGKFDLVLNLFTSFGYFENIEENRRVVQNIFDALAPGGIFVLDFFNAEKVIAGLVPAETQQAGGIRFDITRRHTGGRIVKDIRIDDQGKNFHFQERVQAFSRQDLRKIVESKGFTVYDTWGNYAGDPWHADSPRTILFCRKSPKAL